MRHHSSFPRHRSSFHHSHHTMHHFMTNSTTTNNFTNARVITSASPKTKKYILITGIILIILGIISCIFGVINLSSFVSISDEFEQFNQAAGNTFIGMIILSGGVFLIFIGFALVYFSQIGRVASYIATETAPAVTTAADAAGKGITSGINEAGGVQMNTQGTAKEVIKIKCPNCGYLESEDAEFCSKCGKKI